MKLIMKKYQKLFTSIITVLLTVVLVQSTGHLLDPKWSEDGLDQIRAFNSLEKDSLDVIVLGSSRAWKNVDTRVMNNIYGLRAYNYGCNWQSINTTYLFLEDALRSQNPKVVCIEVGLVYSVKSNVDMDGEIYYTRAIKDFDGKSDYLSKCFEDDVERYVSYYVPLVMFHENWTEINFENYRFPGPERWIDSYGYCQSMDVEQFDLPDANSFPQYDLSVESIEVLNSIVKTCKAKGIEVIFFTCPYVGEYNFSDAMYAYSENNGCVYIDLFRCSDEIGINGQTDFQDAGHLNCSGAGKVAAFLSEYIIENYNVDHY